MKKHLLPFVEILCYCLMPNHFHWLVYTKPEACELSSAVKANHKWTDESKSSDHSDKYQQNLSHQIKIFLSSYTRAINRQEERSGSLFRQKTKVKDGAIDGVITIDGKNKDLFFKLDNDYPRICFDYIHNNPVKGKLLKIKLIGNSPQQGIMLD